MGGESPKKEDHQMGSSQGTIGPNYSSNQAQHNQDGPVSETKEGGSLKGQSLLRRLKTNHQGRKVEGRGRK